jgi:SAM-dependent methyltransferase
VRWRSSARAAALAALVATGPAAGQEEPAPAGDGVSPPALTEYMGRTIAQTMHWKGAGWLVRATREREENSARMIDLLDLEPGMTACDLGCGNGYHTLMMATRVAPDGKVVGVDIQPEMLVMLEKRASAEGVTNIETVEGELHDPKLPAGQFDLVLMADVYHEFSHPEQMLAAIRRALKPDGLAVLVEFRAEDPTVPIKPEHKMTKDQVVKELGANGFTLARSEDSLPWQHLLFFRAEPRG